MAEGIGSAESLAAVNQGYVGRVEEVLVEEDHEQHSVRHWKGRTRTNKLVFFPDEGSSDEDILAAGMVVPVRIERTTAWSLQGCKVRV